MRSLLIFVSILSFFMVSCSVKGQFSRSSVLARIDDKIITVGDFEDYFALRMGGYVTKNDPEKYTRIKYFMLNQMIEEEIILDIAKSEKIEVPEFQVEQELARFKQQYKTEEAFQAYLTERNITMKDFQESLKRLRIIRLVEEKKVYESINITDKETFKYYSEHQNEFNQPESVTVNEMVFDTLDEAKKVVDRLSKGEQFEDIANALKGSLEERQDKSYTKDELPPTFAKELFSLGSGRVSSILEDEYGKFHLFEMRNKRYPKLVEYKTVEDAIRVTLLLQKRELRYNQWINSKKKLYMIEIDEEYFKNE